MNARTFPVHTTLFLHVVILLAVLPFAARADEQVAVSRLRLTLERTSREETPAGGMISFFHLIRPRTVGLVSLRPGTRFRVTAVAYSSTVDQTDLTPCVTAGGTRVRSGIIATNFLPIGTRLRVGETVYVVEDRMNARYNGVPIVDIWYPTREQARAFGAKILDVEILGPVGADAAETEPVTVVTSPTQQESLEPAALPVAPEVPGFLERVRVGLHDLGTQIRSLLAVRLAIPQEEDCLTTGTGDQ